MVFRFLILSDEVDDFRREIKIDSDSTFFDLFKAIINCTGYDDKEMSSFFICDDNWRKKEEITLLEMDTDSDMDSYVMDSTQLSEFLEDEKQKLMFMFDYLNERSLYLELAEIITGKSLETAVCSFSEGEAPTQQLLLEDEKPIISVGDIDESFYGDEDFDIDELDREGFEGLDDIELSGSNDPELF